ncbi:major facilitator superfamily domain-containing protein [Peziza echinospora]|nr:major facilitator superfamily domain-containing protein [Peziza echinospora]
MISQLPPVDRGRGAWTYLAVAFLVEGLCWGFPFSYGVFQSYYSHTAPFAGSKELSVIGTVSSGIPYLASPFLFTLINMYPNYRKTMMWFGLATSILACVASSFATKSWHLITTQGALYGIGTVFLYCPTFSLLNEWFVRRRGLAFGVMFAGTGICGLILPFLFEKLLSSYGHAVTLRIWGVVLFVLTTPALFFIKPRLPPSAYQTPAGRSRRKAAISFSFMKSPLFLVLAFSNFFQGLGYFLPGIYLPSYALDLSLPRIESTVVLSIFNLASVFGQIGLGFLSDRFDVHYVLFYSTSVSALAVYLLWGMSKNFGALLSFAILYGISAGGYSVLWTRFAGLITGEDNSPMVLTLIGVFSFERGIGNILSGPFSSVLVRHGTTTKNPGGGYEYGLRKYESMVLFVGTAMLVSCVGIGGKLVAKRPTQKGG